MGTAQKWWKGGRLAVVTWGGEAKARHGGTCNPGTGKGVRRIPDLKSAGLYSKFRIILNQPSETLSR